MVYVAPKATVDASTAAAAIAEAPTAAIGALIAKATETSVNLPPEFPSSMENEIKIEVTQEANGTYVDGSIYEWTSLPATDTENDVITIECDDFNKFPEIFF